MSTSFRLQAKKNTFWREAFIAALPAVISSNLTRNGQAAQSIDDRLLLAKDFANEALRLAISQGRL